MYNTNKACAVCCQLSFIFNELPNKDVEYCYYINATKERRIITMKISLGSKNWSRQV